MRQFRPAGSVSVVITVYNEDPAHLAEAIQSVQAQTIPPHEIIVVEDGALRDYRALLESYPSVRIIRQQNQGLSAARNTGLAAATGDFVLFLDGDDRMMQHSLQHNLRRLAAHPSALMAYGGYRLIDSDGSPSFQARLPALKPDHYATMLEGNCIGMHAAVLYRRPALQTLDGFDPKLRACEDYELYLRIARHGEIVAGSEVIAEYRQHGDNMSGDRTMMLKTVLRVLDMQDEHVRGKPEWEQARENGRDFCRAFYARGQLAVTLEALGQRRRLGRALGGLARMALFVPITIVKEAKMEILDRLRARKRHGAVNFGDLRRTTPISRHFGYDRGNPVDRHYVEDFLVRHADDIRGRVLEVGDNEYTMRFGAERVELSEVLHVDPAVPNVTYCTDLTEGEGIPDGIFDCIVLTQTLHLVYEFQKAVATLHRILKPGGVLLLTVPGVSSIDSGEWGDIWFWSFTQASLRRLMAEQFGPGAVETMVYGNVLTATAFLYGLAETELRPHEFHVCDPQYPVIVTARVTKGGDAAQAQA